MPVALAGSKYKILHTFGSGNDANSPSGPLTLDKKGNLYGATYGGGPQNDGTVFELVGTGGKWTEKILYSFPVGSDGATPFGNLVMDVGGNLYGDTPQDGGFAPSTLFELSPGSKGWNHAVLYEPGSYGGLVLDRSGDIYGFMGLGDSGAGAIAVLSPGSKGWTYTQLYSFCSAGCPDGVEPDAPLSWDAQGNLYGTTLFGGNGSPKCPGNLGCGVAFQMTPNSDGTWTYHVMHRFANFPTDGQYPYSGLVVDGSGNAYGATAGGGAHGNGTIFKMTPSSGGRWKQSVLYDFPNCAEGCAPSFTLVFDKAGNLYGAGGGGNPGCGPYTCGTVFKLSPQNNGAWKYSVCLLYTSPSPRDS